MAMAGVSLTGRFEFLWVIILQIAYVYYFVLRMGKGIPRLLALLPILPISFVVPWRGETGPERAALAFLFLWMMMSKLLMLVWNVGPGADPEVLSSFPRFLSDMTMALHIKRGSPPAASQKKDDSEEIERNMDEDSHRSRKKVDAEEIEKKMDEDGNRRGGSQTVGRRKSQASKKGNGKSSAVQADDVANKTRKGISKAFSTVSSMISTLTTSLSWQIVLLRSTMYFTMSVMWLRLVLCCEPFQSEYVEDGALMILVYLMCLFLFEGCAAVPASIFGSELHPQFNMPYLSTSLADFWGRRWNLLVNNLLRVTVYDPVIKLVSSVKEKPSNRNKGIAVMAAFIVSGLMHELILFYLSKTPPSWQMTTFFVVNGAGTVVEGLVKPRQRGMPTFLRRAYTLTFVFFTTAWFLFPPVRNVGMIKQTLAESQVFTVWIQRLLLGLVGIQ